MKGVIKIVVLVVIALASFAGYTVLFSVLAGLKPAQAFSFSSSQKITANAENKDSAKKEVASIPVAQKQAAQTDTITAVPPDSATANSEPDTSKAVFDMLQIQLTQIRMEKAQLEKLKNDLAPLLKAKSRADSLQLYNLAKMYDGVDPEQLATMMSNMNDSLVAMILPKMKSQKAGKILQSMPADRAARISSKLLGIN